MNPVSKLAANSHVPAALKIDPKPKLRAGVKKGSKTIVPVNHAMHIRATSTSASSVCSMTALEMPKRSSNVAKLIKSTKPASVRLAIGFVGCALVMSEEIFMKIMPKPLLLFHFILLNKVWRSMTAFNG